MKKGIIIFLKLIGFLLAFSAVMFITDPIVNLSSNIIENDYLLNFMSVMLEVGGALLIVKAFLGKRKFSEIGLVLKIDRKGAIYAGAGLLLGGAVILLILILGGYTFDRFIWDKFFLEDIIPAILIGFLHSMSTAINEGIMLRGYVFKLLSYKNQYIGIVLTAIVFVFINTLTIGFSPLPLIGLFLFSTFLSQIFIFTGNLIYSIMFHGFWYFTTMYIFSPVGSKTYGVIMFGSTNRIILSGGSIGIWGSIVFIMIILVCNIILFRKLRGREN